ncbi:MAG: ParA family protein [Cytophagales bacterium]|nr:ParA family protein [Rhizobacter sp.]
MPVVAVINRKGGSGKSTLATHLAAYCAHSGIPVMLGDVDKQQSTQAWLRLRAAQTVSTLSPIVGWTVDPKSVLRAPPGISHVVLDTPGGLRGFDLARVVMFADVILMPVCNSVFDRESAADCYAELMTLPRVSSGRCQVAAVGMRLDARTKADEVLKEWADKLKLPFIGVLRETQGYVRCIERGLTLFDMPAAKVEADLAQWKPILNWLAPVLRPAPAAEPVKPAASLAPAANGSRFDSLKPAQSSLLVYGKADASPKRPAAPPVPAAAPQRPNVVNRLGSLLESWGVSRFLQR